LKKRIPARRKEGPAPMTPVISGRHEQVYLSPEFLTWAKKRQFKAGFLAECMLHSLALDNPETDVFIRSATPLEPEVFDLGKEAA
jgi:hypothetical protein